MSDVFLEPDYIPPFRRNVIKRKEMRAGKKGKGWQERQAWERGAVDAPEDFLWFEHPKFGDYYPKEKIAQFTKAAQKFGVDPHLYVSLGIAESGLGYKDPNNPARINFSDNSPELWTMVRKGLIASLDTAGMSTEFGAHYLKRELGRHKDLLSGVQAYSGTGRKPYKGDKKGMRDAFGTTTFFNTPYEEIDFWRDKPQGKRVLDVLGALKSQKHIADYISELASIPYMRARRDW